MGANKKESKNDKKENKQDIDKGPLKDKHVNQYGEKDNESKKKRGA
ncbi:hypothetical protein ACFSYG_02220 [Leeuwenhoekiella polynyae]|uniref:Uncharacterized protein n=1 Tax=Leeuwenhoekiella polynyae TaxID=1550906 RepID=A0A4V1KRW1_9FLAO|nr:hypothetical protein [Leeuwenhoekiella polynyae]RXG26294.1 hypothetical protein DSM02_288 [Leeuwenhoekiella polynyae]